MYISEELLDQCDAAVEKSGADSRSEFICDAILHYIAVINMKENSRVLTPALESVIGSKIALTEDRINRIVFKLGVEVAMMNNIMAVTHNIDPAPWNRSAVTAPTRLLPLAASTGWKMR